MCGCTAINPDEIPDGGPMDAGDGGARDGGTDAGMMDAGPVDAGMIDAGPFDAGMMDSGPLDAGMMDAGPFDAGSEACVPVTWYRDCDGDDYAPVGAPTLVQCGEPAPDACGGGWTQVSADCDDADAATFPGATEFPGDGVDQSCDGQEICYRDADNDFYRSSMTLTSTDTDCADSAEAPSTAVMDCNDGAAAINPAAVEVVGDGIDQDCDNRESCWVDTDSDGARTSATVFSGDVDCSDPGEAVTDHPIDCDDASASIRPGALELCNAIDEDCDTFDRNGCPNATETFSSITYSSLYGGATGGTSTAGCDPGDALVGFDVWTDATTPYVNAIGSVCRAVTITETMASPEYTYTLDWTGGSYYTRGPYGTPSGTVTNLRCPTNHVVHGIEGRTSTFLDELTVTCVRYAFTRSGTTWVPSASSTTTLGPAGTPGGIAFSAQCSGTGVGRGMRVRTASCDVSLCVEAIALGCSDLGYTPQ